jgi:hypothetical protein
LCDEQGETYATVGTYDPIVTMGPQTQQSLMALLRECEQADAGFLYDGLSQGLQYQGVAARYNQGSVLSLNAATGQVMPDFLPTADDFGRVNVAIASRTNGGSATLTDEDGPLGSDNVGVYDNQVTINSETDAYLPDRAGWMLHQGTLVGYRYPSLSLNLRKTPSKAADWLAVTPGKAITISPPYSTQFDGDDINLVVEGWTEQLAKLVWEVSPINCSRQDSYQVAVYGTAPGSGPDRYDADNSTLAARRPHLADRFENGRITGSDAPARIEQAGDLKIEINGVDLSDLR